MNTFVLFIAMVVLTCCVNSSGQQPQPKATNPVPISPSAGASPGFQTPVSIQVFGMVKQSGISVAWTNGITLTDAIALSGGFTEFADQREVQLGRSNEWFGYFSFISPVKKGSTDDPPLKPGDRLWVPPRYLRGKPVVPTPRPPSALTGAPESQTNLNVQVLGHVKQHGSVAWTNGMNMTDAIALAGGFGEFADRREIKLRRSNESFGFYIFVAPVEKGSIGDPPLKPGDIVFVPPQYISGKPVALTPLPPSALPK